MEEMINALREEVESLKAEISAERERAEEIKRTSAIMLELKGAGATDVDYLIYKTNSDVSFDENGSIVDAEGYVKGVKERFPQFFKETKIEGVLPGESKEATGGVLTYSQEMRGKSFA